MAKYIVGGIFIIILLPIFIFTNKDVDPKVDSNKLGTVKKEELQKDDIYTNYGIELFNSESQNQLKQNKENNQKEKEELQATLFTTIPVKEETNNEVNQLFLGNYIDKNKDYIIETKSDDNLVKYLSYGAIALLAITLVSVTIHVSSKRLDNNKNNSEEFEL